MSARRRLTLAATALLLCGCATGGSTVPSITVGGVPDSQRSLAPGDVASARAAAGIEPCPASNLSAAARDGGLPALTLDCLGGDSKVNLAGLPTGRPRVVNVWAQWCGPCTEEAPYFGEVHAQVRGRVDFLGINYADPFAGKVIDFAQHFGTTYPQLVDVKQRARVPLRISGPPQTYFVDAQGRLVHHQTAPYRDAAELRADIEQYLGVQV